MSCAICGTENREDAQVCARCGRAMPTGLQRADARPAGAAAAASVGNLMGALAVLAFVLVVAQNAWFAKSSHQVRNLMVDVAFVGLAIPILLAGIAAFRGARGAILASLGLTFSVAAIADPSTLSTLATLVAFGSVVLSAVAVGTDAALRSSITPDLQTLRANGRRIGGLVLTGVLALVVLTFSHARTRHLLGYGDVFGAHPFIVVVLFGLLGLGLLSRPRTGGLGLSLGLAVVVLIDALGRVFADLAFSNHSNDNPSLLLVGLLLAAGLVALVATELLSEPRRESSLARAGAAASWAAPQGNGPGGWAPSAASAPVWSPAQPHVATSGSALPLATLGSRLGAHLIDSLFGLVPLAIFYAGLIASISTSSRNSYGQSSSAPLVAGVVVALGLGVVVLIVFVQFWRVGQTPGKRAMKLRVISATSGQSLGLGEMAVRELVFRGLVIGLLNAITCGIGGIVSVLMIFSDRRQTLWDRMARTLVVQDPTGRSLGARSAPRVHAPQPVPQQAPWSPAGHSPPAQIPASAALPSIFMASPALTPRPMADASMTLEPVRPRARQLRLPNGSIVPIEGVVLFGRNPSASPTDPPMSRTIAVDDPERSISKTHLAFGVDNGRIWVEDRHSTNGTSVSRPNGTTLPLAPGVRTFVDNGASIVFGAQSVVVVD